ncbi:hypothetical protein E4U53_007166 [Claviceps sorghi]|nr:hypothetical protein E4U53_007166 [Claviceps sorghi]
MQPSSPPASLPSPPPRFQVIGGANQQWAKLMQNVLRPVLVHLNADTTLAFSIAMSAKGDFADVHPLHVIASRVATGDDVNNLL